MKRILFFSLFLLFVSTDIFGQNVQSDSATVCEVDENGKYPCDHMPQYPGGIEALFEYLNKNIQYPEEAVKKKIKGKVLVTFIVSKEGKIENVKINKGLSPLCDAEVIKVVQNMPDWTPGVQKGKKVSVEYKLPVTFKPKPKGYVH